MTINVVFYLNKIASYLKVQPGKISIDSDFIPSRVVNNNKVRGFLNIILQFLNESSSNLAGKNNLETAEIRQWIEYAIVYAVHHETSSNINQILTELNAVLLTRTYLVSHKLTIADIVLYYVLHSIIKNLTNFDKERYINVSRWFDNLQRNPSIRQSSKIVDFTTIYLINAAPVK